jgi:hypothetical protein
MLTFVVWAIGIIILLNMLSVNLAILGSIAEEKGYWALVLGLFISVIFWVWILSVIL